MYHDLYVLEIYSRRGFVSLFAIDQRNIMSKLFSQKNKYFVKIVVISEFKSLVQMIHC